MLFKIRIEKLSVEWEDGTIISIGPDALTRIYEHIADPEAACAALGPIIGQHAITRPRPRRVRTPRAGESAQRKRSQPTRSAPTRAYDALASCSATPTAAQERRRRVDGHRRP